MSSLQGQKTSMIILSSSSVSQKSSTQRKREAIGLIVALLFFIGFKIACLVFAAHLVEQGCRSYVQKRDSASSLRSTNVASSTGLENDTVINPSNVISWDIKIT